MSTSAVVLAVREGNPEDIEDWDDLIREGIEVITPNPFSSGGAQWNIAAAYGAQLEAGKTKDEALEYLRTLFANVPVQPKGARESLQVFQAGKGDVLLAYENEAKLAQANGEPIDYVIPTSTILIQNPIATTKDSGNPAAAQAFVDFALSAPAQEVFAREGLPVGAAGGRGRVRRRLPGDPRSVHDGRGPRRLVDLQGRVLRPGQRLRRRHLRGPGLQSGR